MTVLTWSLVPTVLVPFFLMVHALVFAKLSARANSSIAADELAGRLRPAG